MEGSRNGGGMAQWWEHSPPHQCGPGSIPAVMGWVCCWFSSQLRGFFRVLWFFLPPQKLTFLNSKWTGEAQFRVAVGLLFKPRPNAEPFVWIKVLFACKRKLISIWMVLHLASVWKGCQEQLENRLLVEEHRFVSPWLSVSPSQNKVALFCYFIL